MRVMLFDDSRHEVNVGPTARHSRPDPGSGATTWTMLLPSRTSLVSIDMESNVVGSMSVMRLKAAEKDSSRSSPTSVVASIRVIRLLLILSNTRDVILLNASGSMYVMLFPMRCSCSTDASPRRPSTVIRASWFRAKLTDVSLARFERLLGATDVTALSLSRIALVVAPQK